MFAFTCGFFKFFNVQKNSTYIVYLFFIKMKKKHPPCEFKLSSCTDLRKTYFTLLTFLSQEESVEWLN